MKHDFIRAPRAPRHRQPRYYDAVLMRNEFEVLQAQHGNA
jgi:hypothetical protein